MAPNQFNHGQPRGMGKFIGAVVGLAFCGIGVTVIGFLWSQPFDAYHSPPLFFRIFGSLIAVVFVAVGGGSAYASITGKGHLSRAHRHVSTIVEQSQDEAADTQLRSDSSYSCESCGAPLDSNADVSPLGDVKCAHCDRWFNIHGKTS